jgi:hypothetical protein
MKRIELFLLILVIGSLWGFFEMLKLPVFTLCIIGIFFLILGRRAVNVPGTSILIGLIVCFYKTYSAHFFICQWAGVMALAGSFELFATFVFNENWHQKFNPFFIGALTNVTALFIFTGTVNYIFPEPYWVAGGIDRVLNYALYTSLPAAVISGMIAAPAGNFWGAKLGQLNFQLNKKLLPGIYLLTTAFLWIAAS